MNPSNQKPTDVSLGYGPFLTTEGIIESHRKPKRCQVNNGRDLEEKRRQWRQQPNFRQAGISEEKKSELIKVKGRHGKLRGKGSGVRERGLGQCREKFRGANMEQGQRSKAFNGGGMMKIRAN